ncbi:MAG: acetylornithine deacetylase [Rhodospirillaceae bacterium]|jgi:acetylornithine deacetylase|nr:acetylornithine deacetylase [Rhodospirillaceae bacterium]
MAGDTYTVPEMLGHLIGFDTTSKFSNLALIDFVDDYLAGHGIASTRVPNGAGDKANLIASVGPVVEGGVVLSGHTDVVPVAGQDWDTDPFTLSPDKDPASGRLHGRGTSDMKSFIAIALALVPEFQARDLKVPIHFALSYDEEVGCLGAIGLLEKLCADLPLPMAAIVGEPSEMKVVNAHRGVAKVTTTVRGLPGHASATHRGVSAVAYGAECVAFLNRLAADLADQGLAESDFDPPFTTINVGRIDGGSAVNVIAPECRLDWECRPIPGRSIADVIDPFRAYCADTLEPAMRAIGPDCVIETTVINEVPAFEPLADSPAEALALALTGQNRAGTVPFASEAGLFQHSGIPAVICGPGSPDQAHRANEYVTTNDLDACTDFLRKLADWAESR